MTECDVQCSLEPGSTNLVTVRGALPALAVEKESPYTDFSVEDFVQYV